MEFEKIKKENLGILPTPIHKLENLSKKLGPNIYVKRDDMTGLGMGGNKIRKLEYLVKDALDQGATALLTYGGIQTNHGMLTAAVAGKLGLKSILVLYGSDIDQEPSGNLLLDKVLGSDIRLLDITDLDSEEKAEKIDDLTNQILAEYQARGEKVYIIPMGGSSELGALGYVNAAKEIKDRAQAMDINFDYIFCGQGSHGTFAGLWLGAKYFAMDSRVIGVNVMETGQEIKEEISDYINRISQAYNMGITANPGDLDIAGDYSGLGYAIPDENTLAHVLDLGREEGIFIDLTYTGKIFTGMVDMVKTGKVKKESNILFIHSGGYPGIFSRDQVNFINESLK